MAEISNNEEPKTFEEKRRNFFFELARRYQPYYELHIKSGQTVRYKDKAEGGKTLQRWGDPTQHCLVEAAASEVLGDMLQLSPEDKQDFTIAAVVHDAQKRPEIEKLRGVTNPIEVERVYRESKQFLLDNGVPPRVVGLTEAVAHTSLPNFAKLRPDGSIALKDNLSTVDMAMHYLDDITRGTDLVEFDTRIDYLEEVAPTRYPYNEEGKTIWGGRTFFQAQREVGHLIENRLAQIAGVENPKELPKIIREKLLEKIENP